jgi:hypothetical protein
VKRARPRTKVKAPPRALVDAVPELVAGLVQLAEVYERLCRGDVIEAGDRELLRSIVSDILGEADPRDRFFEASGAPESAWHHVFVAQDVHLQDDFATAPKKAIARVANAWGLKDETVRGIERRYRTVVCAVAGNRNIVEAQRKRWLERSATLPPTRRVRKVPSKP